MGEPDTSANPRTTRLASGGRFKVKAAASAMTPDDKAVERGVFNTDRELWREETGLPGDPGSYYAPSIHVTEGGGIGINVGGTVIVKPLREWHRLAQPAEQDDTGRKALDRYYASTCPCVAAERYVESCPKHGFRPHSAKQVSDDTEAALRHTMRLQADEDEPPALKAAQVSDELEIDAAAMPALHSSTGEAGASNLPNEQNAVVRRLQKWMDDVRLSVNVRNDIGDAIEALRAANVQPLPDDVREMARRLRALIIMDEVGSDNPLGRDAADLLERYCTDRRWAK